MSRNSPGARSSSRQVPRCTMQPLSMTMISSQFCRVDRRCAMERTVVPHSSFIFSISAWMRFSEVLSSAEVASSSIRMRGFLRKMRASAMRWR